MELVVYTTTRTQCRSRNGSVVTSDWSTCMELKLDGAKLNLLILVTAVVRPLYILSHSYTKENTAVDVVYPLV